jgi:hypothetical protein
MPFTGVWSIQLVKANYCIWRIFILTSRGWITFIGRGSHFFTVVLFGCPPSPLRQLRQASTTRDFLPSLL